jgi:L-threonylcarbamoyladenylate synthase
VVADALKAGLPVILPTDTVYGLCANAFDQEAVERLYRLKGRRATQPTALLCASVDQLGELLPELDEPAARAARALLPGPYTLIVANPERRFPWLNAQRPESLGVRVPKLPASSAEALVDVGAVAATSANAPGGRDPRRLNDVPERIRAGCGALVDAGELPGTPSTVVDLTGDQPKVLREGAVAAIETLARVRAAVARGE